MEKRQLFRTSSTGGPAAHAAPPATSARAYSGAKAGTSSSMAGPTLISQIKERLPLADFVQRSIPLKKAGKDEMVGLCPFHEEKSPSFHVSTKDHVFNCKGCGESGNVVHFHSKITGMDYESAKFALADELGLRKERAQDNGLSLLQAAAQRYHDGLERKPEAKHYLLKRGMTEQTMKRFSIGYCFGDEWAAAGAKAKETATKAGILYESERAKGIINLMYRRIVFPIRNQHGQVVAFGGRITPEAETQAEEDKRKSPKYLNTADTEYFKKSEILFGIYEAKAGISREQFAVVVEGYMDVAILHQYGADNAVGVMGAAANEKAFASLWKMTNHIVFCLDGDAAGQRGTMRSITEAAVNMPEGGKIGILEMPDGVDPDEYVIEHGTETFKEQCRTAIPLSAYLCRETLPDFNGLVSVEDRAAFVARMEEMAATFANAPGVGAGIVAEAKAIVSAKVIDSALKRYDIQASPEEIEVALQMVAGLKKNSSRPRLG